MPGIMDAVPEAHQHEDVMVQTAHQLNPAMERVRQARQLLHEASDRLTLTRQEVEKDQRIERVRQARELLHATNQQLAQIRQQVEEDQRQNAAGPAAEDDSMWAENTPGTTSGPERDAQGRIGLTS